MQVMLLLYSDETVWARMSDEERAREFGAYMAYSKALREAGAMVAGAPLEPTSAAHTVRMARGGPQVLDGPYAETKEQLGGYFLLDVPDMQAALRWATRCPGAAHGTVEVRPLAEMPKA